MAAGHGAAHPAGLHHQPPGRGPLDYFLNNTNVKPLSNRSRNCKPRVLSPDPLLRDYVGDYALIVQVYEVVYNNFDLESARQKPLRNLLAMTDALIRKYVKVKSQRGMAVVAR